MSATDYLGIVIQQSLADERWLDSVRVEARRQIGSWTFLLVAASEVELGEQLDGLRRAMQSDQPWYAHYFRDGELIVVFRDETFRIGGDPQTWAPAVQHGLGLGIPREQLDFKPRTEEDARTFFGMS